MFIKKIMRTRPTLKQISKMRKEDELVINSKWNFFSTKKWDVFLFKCMKMIDQVKMIDTTGY